MKSFFYSPKFLIPLVLSPFMAMFFMLNCSSPVEEGTQTGGRTNKRNEDTKQTNVLKCNLPKCSGSKCCDKEDEECTDYCGDSDYLNLSGDGYHKCLALEKKFVHDKLVIIFKDVLEDPDEEKLIQKIQEEELDIICSAMKELSLDLLEDLIDDYGPYEAQLLLNYVGVKKPALELFTKTQEKEDGIDLFKKLLEKAGDSSGTATKEAKMLQALKDKSEFQDENEVSLLERALNNNNKDLVHFIHKNIVHDKDEGLCGGDNERFHPQPVDRAQDIKYDANDPNLIPGYGAGSGVPSALSFASDRSQYACILAFYCYIDNTRGGNILRKKLAWLLKESGVRSFIKSPVRKGGLNLSSQKAQDEWPHQACFELNLRWKNGAVDMGLDEVPNPNP